MNYQLQERHPDTDEIDLFELMRALWVRKRLIVSCAVIGFVLAVAYALLATERWTSVAYISKPRISHIADYLELRRTLARADGNYTVDRQALADSLFGEVVRQLSAEQNKRAFLDSSAYLDDLPADATPQARALRLEQAARDLVITKPQEGLINPYHTVSFSASTPEMAQSILAGYLAESNRRAIEVLDNEFRDALTSSILTRRTERHLIESELITKRRNWIETLTAALDTARAAGVTNYMEGRAISGSVVVELTERQRLFMLGENYLSAELKTAQESPVVYPVRYYEIEEQLALLEPLLNYQAPQVSAYKYQLEPTLPLRRVSPKRTLIVLLGVVLGGMIGIFAALLHAIAQRRSQLTLPLHQSRPALELS